MGGPPVSPGFPVEGINTTLQVTQYLDTTPRIRPRDHIGSGRFAIATLQGMESARARRATRNDGDKELNTQSNQSNAGLGRIGGRVGV